MVDGCRFALLSSALRARVQPDPLATIELASWNGFVSYLLSMRRNDHDAM